MAQISVRAIQHAEVPQPRHVELTPYKALAPPFQISSIDLPPWPKMRIGYMNSTVRKQVARMMRSKSWVWSVVWTPVGVMEVMGLVQRFTYGRAVSLGVEGTEGGAGEIPFGRLNMGKKSVPC